MKPILAGYVNLTDDGSLTTDDIKKLTHINLAFGQVDKGDITFDQSSLYKRLDQLRAENPAIKIQLSLVGKTASDFPVGAGSQAGRQKIAESCVHMIENYGFDGIDLDWEYPGCPANFQNSTPEDKENFTYLIQEIRQALDKCSGDHKLLTIAAGADEYYTANTEMDKIAPLLDYVFVMTYDLRCGFHALTGHHSNLYGAQADIFRTSCQRSAEVFLQAGVPANKIILGAAFYSRQWKEVPNRYNGFLQYTPTACGYGPGYHELVESYINKNDYVRYWDDECKAPYLFNGNHFISYDDPESLAHKSNFVKNQGLGGIFYWDHNSDRTHTLLEALHTHLAQ